MSNAMTEDIYEREFSFQLSQRFAQRWLLLCFRMFRRLDGRIQATPIAGRQILNQWKRWSQEDGKRAHEKPKKRIRSWSDDDREPRRAAFSYAVVPAEVINLLCRNEVKT